MAPPDTAVIAIVFQVNAVIPGSAASCVNSIAINIPFVRVPILNVALRVVKLAVFVSDSPDVPKVTLMAVCPA
jgi:hypothetical protein